jgi:N-methylhydantoinase A/oxoprolinase/acetone carboxylase beta subunit
MSSSKSWRIGVDVGGTFTDLFASSGDSHFTLKVPSTPHDPSIAVIAGLSRFMDATGAKPNAVARILHGTTVATNAVLERKGAPLGLLATAGFTDVLEIGRQLRSDMYAIKLEPETPTFLAPGKMRAGVTERVGPDGEIITSLDEAAARTAIDALVADGARSIAIALLFSFRNPTHERRLRELVEAAHPDLSVSISSEVDPAFREYERTVATAFDAYIKPVVARYLSRLDQQLRDIGIEAPLQVMQSRAALSNVTVAQARPVRLFLSGPAAGVAGGEAVARAFRQSGAITLDVGGTSSDIALVQDGKPMLRSEGVIDGYPVRVPMVDVNAIGAGGGSIAWVDDSGALRVGPHSAGSDPGPACYGRGGDAPTVTDASVVLGILNPNAFGSGDIALDVDAATAAIRKSIAEPLGLDVHAAAAGIHQVVNAQMAEGIRLVSICRGYDPREFALVALGGAGPVHACALAEELGIERIIIPLTPGVLSAQGLLDAPIEHEASNAFGCAMLDLDPNELRPVLSTLDDQCAAMMALENVPGTSITTRYSADICYVGQSHFLEVSLDLDAESPIELLRQRFLEQHDRVYGYAFEAPTQIVNLRAVHRSDTSGGAARNQSTLVDSVAEKSTPAKIRSVQIPGATPLQPTSIYERSHITPGTKIRGPGIVEQPDTTTVVNPGWLAEAAAEGSMLLTRDDRP